MFSGSAALKTRCVTCFLLQSLLWWKIDRRYARLTRPFMYLLSTWLWKLSSSPVSVGLL